MGEPDFYLVFWIRKVLTTYNPSGNPHSIRCRILFVLWLSMRYQKKYVCEQASKILVNTHIQTFAQYVFGKGLSVVATSNLVCTLHVMHIKQYSLRSTVCIFRTLISFSCNKYAIFSPFLALKNIFSFPSDWNLSCLTQLFLERNVWYVFWVFAIFFSH